MFIIGKILSAGYGFGIAMNQDISKMFENVVLPKLLQAGWAIQTNESQHDRYFIHSDAPPTNLRLGLDYFASPLDVLKYVDTNSRWKVYCLPPAWHGYFSQSSHDQNGEDPVPTRMHWGQHYSSDAPYPLTQYTPYRFPSESGISSSYPRDSVMSMSAITNQVNVSPVAWRGAIKSSTISQLPQPPVVRSGIKISDLMTQSPETHSSQSHSSWQHDPIANVGIGMQQDTWYTHISKEKHEYPPTATSLNILRSSQEEHMIDYEPGPYDRDNPAVDGTSDQIEFYSSLGHLRSQDDESVNRNIADLHEFRRRSPNGIFTNPCTKTSTTRKVMYRELVTEFYKKYNPGMLVNNIDHVLERFKSREDVLIRELRMKYCPNDVRVWDEIHRSWLKLEHCREKRAVKLNKQLALKCPLCGRQIRVKSEYYLHMEKHSIALENDVDVIHVAVEHILGEMIQCIVYDTIDMYELSIDYTLSTTANGHDRCNKTAKKRKSLKGGDAVGDIRAKKRGRPRKHGPARLETENSAHEAPCRLHVLDRRMSVGELCVSNSGLKWPLFRCIAMQCSTWFHVHCHGIPTASSDPSRATCFKCYRGRGRRLHEARGCLKRQKVTLLQNSSEFVRQQATSARKDSDICEELNLNEHRLWENIARLSNANVCNEWVYTEVEHFIRRDIINDHPVGMKLPRKQLFDGVLSRDDKCGRGCCQKMSRANSRYCSDTCGILAAERELHDAIRLSDILRSSDLGTSIHASPGDIMSMTLLSKAMEQPNKTVDISHTAGIILRSDKLKMTLGEIERKILDVYRQRERERSRLQSKYPIQRSSPFQPTNDDEEAMIENVVITASTSPPLDETRLYRPSMRVDAYDEVEKKWFCGEITATDKILGVQVSRQNFHDWNKWINTGHLSDPGTYSNASPLSVDERDERQVLLEAVRADRSRSKILAEGQAKGQSKPDCIPVGNTANGAIIYARLSSIKDLQQIFDCPICGKEVSDPVDVHLSRCFYEVRKLIASEVINITHSVVVGK